MEGRIIREVSYRTWDESKQDDRVFSGALASENAKNKVEVFADGDYFEISIEDIPLLIKVLKEFC